MRLSHPFSGLSGCDDPLAVALCSRVGSDVTPGGRKIELASRGPWRETRTPVRAMTERYDSNGACAVAVYGRTARPSV